MIVKNLIDNIMSRKEKESSKDNQALAEKKTNENMEEPSETIEGESILMRLLEDDEKQKEIEDQLFEEELKKKNSFIFHMLSIISSFVT